MARGSGKFLLLVAAIVSAGLVGSTIFTSKAYAAPAFSLTTTPVSVDLHVSPGSSASQTLQIMNNNPSAVNVALQLEVFSANGTNGEAAINTLPANSPLASWVHFSATNFTVQPGIWTPVKMTVSLPLGASLGYYYAVLFKPSLANSSAPHTTTIKGANAVLVLVDTNSANEVRKLSVSNFSVSKRLYQYLPADFSVTVKNSGNIFLAPTGDIFISKSSDFSHPIGILAINPGDGNVLPHSVRIFKSDWSDGFPVYKTKTIDGQPVEGKNGQPVEQLNWNFAQLDKLRFGKYYARLALVYSNGNEQIPINAVVSFWIIPWELLAVLLLLLLIIVFGCVSLGRAIYRRARKLPKLPLKRVKDPKQ